MIFLKNTVRFFIAWLSHLIYGRPSREIFVLGVTGTKGKSTVLELISHILEQSGKRVAMISSVFMKVASDKEPNPTENTMSGRFFIQKFLRQAVDKHCDYALIEVTSEGVRAQRHKFINFDAALFLNLHPEHIESHGSFEKYRAAKVKFFSYVARFSKKPKKFFFINQTDISSGYFTDAVHGRGKIFYFSKDYFLRTRLKGKRSALSKWFSNDMNLENAAAASAFAESQGISWEITQKALKNFKGLEGRMEVMQEKPFRVVIDYAHTPQSLIKVYQTLGISSFSRRKVGIPTSLSKEQIGASGQLPISNRKLVCVLGSAGGGRDKWKRPELGKIAAEYCREIILTNEDPYNENPLQIIEEISSGFSEIRNSKAEIRNLFKVVDRKEAIKKAVTLAKRGDTIIITGKGSERWIHIANGRKIPWNERKVVEEILNTL